MNIHTWHLYRRTPGKLELLYAGLLFDPPFPPESICNPPVTAKEIKSSLARSPFYVPSCRYMYLQFCSNLRRIHDKSRFLVYGGSRKYSNRRTKLQDKITGSFATILRTNWNCVINISINWATRTHFLQTFLFSRNQVRCLIFCM